MREDEELHKIRLFDFASGRLVALFKGHTNVVLASLFRQMAGISFREAPTRPQFSGTSRRARPGTNSSGTRDLNLYAVGVQPDGSRVVTGSDDKDLRLWRVADGGEIAPMQGHGDKVASVAVAPDGTIASGDWSR